MNGGMASPLLPAAAPPAAAFPRSEAPLHIGRRVGVVLVDGSRRVGLLRGWGSFELSLLRGGRVLRFPVGRIAYVVNLHTWPAHCVATTR